jgi:hypothetical protein
MWIQVQVQVQAQAPAADEENKKKSKYLPRKMEKIEMWLHILTAGSRC